MQLSIKGYQLLKQSEGLRLQVYRDPIGIATIGYGHLIKPGETFDGGITEDQALGLLYNDLAEACGIIRREVTVPVNQGEYDALVDFVFNLGDRLKASTLLRLLNARDYDGARDELAKWDCAGGKVNIGIKARRVAEMALWNQGAEG